MGRLGPVAGLARGSARDVPRRADPVSKGQASAGPVVAPRQPVSLSARVALTRLDRSPSRLQARDGNPERRAGDVVQTHLVEEVHRVRITAVLTADTELQLGTSAATFLGSDSNQLADPGAVDRLERGHTEDATVQVRREERALDIVAREAPCGLGQIVGPEG